LSLSSAASIVVAKGGGQLAERIIETAREHKVPLQEDAALAAALSRLDLGREIPRELYVRVDGRRKTESRSPPLEIPI
jgi:flagellar biosynthesis protein